MALNWWAVALHTLDAALNMTLPSTFKNLRDLAADPRHAIPKARGCHPRTELINVTQELVDHVIEKTQ